MQVLAEDDYSAISKKKMHKDAHGAKEMQLELSQQLFNFNGVKRGFAEERKISNDICDMMMLK